MIAAKQASRADRKLARTRALEWKQFRRDYLFSQRHLAAALGCSRRCVSAIEAAETTYPYPRLLLRFSNLKRKHEREEHQAAERRGQLEALHAAQSGRYDHTYRAERSA